MGQEDITHIRVGKFRVGISGLRRALEETKPLAGRPDPEIAQALYEALKKENYIPDAAREDYQRAFLREFKRSLGEAVAEESGAPVIKILGPGCPNCQKLENLVLELLTELGLPAEVEHVRELAEITAHGVFSTPALIINHRLLAMGKVPGRETLKQWLTEAAGKPAGEGSQGP